MIDINYLDGVSVVVYVCAQGGLFYWTNMTANIVQIGQLTFWTLEYSQKYEIIWNNF